METAIKKLYYKEQPWRFLLFIKSVFTCNQNEIPFQDDSHSGMKKIMFTREFLPGIK